MTEMAKEILEIVVLILVAVVVALVLELTIPRSTTTKKLWRRDDDE